MIAYHDWQRIEFGNCAGQVSVICPGCRRQSFAGTPDRCGRITATCSECDRPIVDQLEHWLAPLPTVGPVEPVNPYDTYGT